MKLLYRYIILELISPLLFGVCAFVSVFLASDLLMRLVNIFRAGGGSFMTIFLIILYSLPPVIVMTLPMSMLLATLLSIGKLSSNSELIAMKAGGVGITRILIPVLFVGLCVSLVTIGLNESVVPKSNKLKEAVYQKAIGEVLPVTGSNVLSSSIGSDGNVEWILFSKELDRDNAVMKDVTVQTFSEGKLRETINASVAKFNNKTWLFKDGMVYTYFLDGRASSWKFEEFMTKITRKPDELVNYSKNPDEMTSLELRRYIDFIKKSNADIKVREMEVKLHQRTSIPFASLVFALIGLPLAMEKQRSGKSLGFGLSIIIIFCYYIAMIISSSLAEGGKISPILAAWLQNIVIGGFGLYLIAQKNR